MSTSQHSQLSIVSGAVRRELSGEWDRAFEPLLDSKQAAALLRMHPKTLLSKARHGEVPAIHRGRLWWFRASALNEWIEKIAS